MTGPESQSLAGEPVDVAALQAHCGELERQLAEAHAQLRQALDQQTAAAEVLSAISRSAFDLQHVLNTLAQSAVRLCAADVGSIGRVDGDVLRAEAFSRSDPNLEAVLREVIYRPDRGSAFGWVLLERRTVHIPDVLADAEYRMASVQQAAGYRAALVVPLLRGGQLVGAFSLVRTRPEAFTDSQIKLLTTLADQAVIAIENSRLIGEMKQRLEEQTAMAEVLQIISRSPTDLQTVLEAIVDRASRLCEGNRAVLSRVDGDRLRFLASTALLAFRGAAFPRSFHPCRSRAPLPVAR